MTPRYKNLFVTAMIGTLFVLQTAHADVVEYRVPSLGTVITMEGKTKVNAGRTVTFFHPKFGKLYFGLEDVTIHKVPSTRSIFSKMLGKAKKSKSAYEVMQVADWALHRGMLNDYYKTIDLALEFDPKNENAIRIKKLQIQLEKPLKDNPELSKKLHEQVHSPKFKIKKSKHFILFHDTPDKPADGHKKPRADERLELLETVYQTFLMKFYSHGVPLDIPKERMMVLLFNDHAAYLDYATAIDPSMKNAIGFWSPTTNISVFFDHGTANHYKGLREVSRQFKKAAIEAKRTRASNAKDIIRSSKALEVLIKITQETSDVEVVSHEATHQLAGNTSLFPRVVSIPRWVHEGLASYFEAPSGAAWGGIGAVNKERLEWYRALAANDREHSSIDFIVGNKIYDRTAGAQSNVLHAYGQAWALTNFLIVKHFDELMEYYRRLGEFPPDTPLSHEVLSDLFTDVFGEDRKALQQEWRAYMRSLKTDMERIIEEEEG